MNRSLELLTFNPRRGGWVWSLRARWRRRLKPQPPANHMARIRHRGTWSHRDPLSLFTHDDTDVGVVDSHVSAWLWTGEEAAVLWNGAQLTLRQLRQEMGVGVGSWRPNSAVGGVFFFPPTIAYSPSHSCGCQTHTHQHIQPNPLRFLVFYPPEVRVWYQPICSNRPRNPNSPTSTSSPTPVLAEFLFPASTQREPHRCTESRTSVTEG